MTETKPWWQSKTERFNAAMAILAVVSTNIETLRGVLPDNWIAWILFLTIVGNAILRVVTKGPISFK